MEKKVVLPVDWGPSHSLPEDQPGWILPYQRHLAKYSRAQWLRYFGPTLEFADQLPTHWPLVNVPIPGDDHGRVTNHFTIRLSMRARASLFFGQDAASRGAESLFLCFSHLEAMHRRPFAWPVLWARGESREKLELAARERARELLEYWSEWGAVKKPPCTPPVVSPRLEISVHKPATRVLVVDDMERWRDAARIWLEIEGCSVTTVSGGTEALLLCAHEDFDVILMDLNMPDQNGWQVARAMREMGIRVPILAITAHTEDVERDMAAGMDGSMPKPWSLTGVREMLDRWGPT